MTKSTKKLIIFLTVLSILWMGLEFIARRLEKDEADHKILDFSFYNFQKNKAKIEILIFGSSHALYGVNPQYFSKSAYNFAYSAEDLFHSYLKLKKYIGSLPALKVVILNIDYFSFGYFEKKSQFRNIAYGYNKYLPDYLSFRYYLELISPFFRCRSWFTDNFKSRYIKKEHPAVIENANLSDDFSVTDAFEKDTIMASGYYFTKKNNRELINDKKASEQIKAFAVDNYSGENLFKNESLLKKFLTLCKKHNIKVLLITTPYFPTYYNNFPLEKSALMYQVIKRNLDENRGIYYRDYSQSNVFTLNDFMDNDHLNARGARLFTRILNTVVGNILIKE